MTRLRLRFSHLNEHKFRHGFLDTLNPLRNCSLEVEDNKHFFLRCLNFQNARRSLFIDISSITSSFKNLSSHLEGELFLFGDSKLPPIDNNLILKASIKYIMTTNRFSVPLLWYCFPSLALNIFNHFFPLASTPSWLFLHCFIWESSEIRACAVFSSLFFGCLFVRYFSFIFCLVQLLSIILLKKKSGNERNWGYYWRLVNVRLVNKFVLQIWACVLEVQNEQLM